MPCKSFPNSRMETSQVPAPKSKTNILGLSPSGIVIGFFLKKKLERSLEKLHLARQSKIAC